MRRGVGIAGLHKQQRQEAQLRRVGADLSHENTAQLRQQLETLREHIETFATQHREAINADPKFRAQFNSMCSTIGVDPLQSSKGLWAQLLGVGDFYFELSVQAADVCMRTRAENGGLMAIVDLHRRLQAIRSASLRGASRSRNAQVVSVDDVRCALAQLRQLGGGYTLVHLAGREYVRSVPTELNRDHNTVLELALPAAFVTLAQLTAKLGWSKERADDALAALLREGIVWVDRQTANGEDAFWVMAMQPGAW
mmetsp:Transcript_10517/g.27287  ORF Transcript_10517/g.27287 Transcript_10517/m.27287 type:complete len:254 (+) Transcript_10517:24-785(+)